MIRLCGTPISNYYNKVKLALLEKNIAFEEVGAPPSQEEAMLARSPMGLVPFIEVGGKSLSESQAILEYLEDVYPGTPLYPKDPWARAKVREIIHVLDLYIDWAGRPLIRGVFFGASMSEELKANAAAAWERGTRALNRLTGLTPFAAGAELSYADCAAYVHLRLASALSKAAHGKDVLDALPGASAYLERMASRPNFARVTAEQNQAMQALAARRKG